MSPNIIRRFMDGQRIKGLLYFIWSMFRCVTKQPFLFSFKVQYSPRRLQGFGNADGETMERLWSYLRPFSKITKEQTLSHRTDLLTDALLHYAEKKISTLGKHQVNENHGFGRMLCWLYIQPFNVLVIHQVSPRSASVTSVGVLQVNGWEIISVKQNDKDRHARRRKLHSWLYTMVNYPEDKDLHFVAF